MAYSVSETHTLDKPILQGLGDVSSTRVESLGYEVLSTSGRKYRYCSVHAGAVATDLGGHPAYFVADTTGPVVTSDATEGTSSVGGQEFAGLLCASITATAALQYMWVEVPNDAVTPDASVSTNVAVSSALAAIGTADAYLDVFVNGTSSRVVAIAMEADTDNLADIIMLGSGGLSASA